MESTWIIITILTELIFNETGVSGEKDMLVKNFDENHGKLMFFLRNAQQSNHPLTAATQVFTKSDLSGIFIKMGLVSKG